MVGEALALALLGCSFSGDATHCSGIATAFCAEHNNTYCFTTDYEFIFANLCHAIEETFYQVANESPLTIITVSNNGFFSIFNFALAIHMHREHPWEALLRGLITVDPWKFQILYMDLYTY